MSVRTGDLRARIQIQKRIRDSDGAGGGTDRWPEVARVWAQVKPLSGREAFVAAQKNPELTHTITIRYVPWVKPSEMRAVVRGRVFDITAVMDVDERHEWLELMCTELAG